MELSEKNKEQLDAFEKMLDEGLFNMCKGAGLVRERLESPDIDEKWDAYIKDYIADAVENLRDYPEAAIGFAAFLGMAVAYNWDKDWTKYKDRKYSYYYGVHGFDDMDEHILGDVLKLGKEDAKKYSSALESCARASLDFLRREQIDLDTSFGFYAVVRCCCVLYKTGATIELSRLGYKNTKLS